MEDWEQFFVDKSNRRAEKERLRARRQKRDAILAAIVTAILILGLLAALALSTD